MRLETWDSEFVRATRAQVHAILRDLPAYGTWWPGTEAHGEPGRVAVRYTPPRLGGRLRRRAIVLTVARDRPGLGVLLAVDGDLVGEAEWYYLDERDGCVVHHIARVEVGDRRWRTTLADLRAWVRTGLHELKDRLEGPRAPGAEPDPVLLRAQREAVAEFRAAVEAHRRCVEQDVGQDVEEDRGGSP